MNSLGFDKSPADTRVVVAMSGGVDSSTAAALMTEQGYEVIGVTLRLYDHGQAVGKKGACCAGQDIFDARRVADTLGISHYVLDYEDRFREQVIEDFADTYLAGETPIPCVRCNQTVKFRDLLGKARELGAAALVTGHYARRVLGGGGPELHRALDDAKDQSYFLFATTREQLNYLRFPLGEIDKSETRAHAERFSLPVAKKPESQDICFVANGSYADIVEKLRPGAADPGDVVDLDGNVIGQHQGIIRFTVGQRRGLGIAAPEPLYVVRVEPDSRRVVAGPKEALLKDRFRVGAINWLGDGDGPAGDLEVTVKIRSAAAPVAAMIRIAENETEVHLRRAEAAIAPGQACVFYDQDRVLGGGWIRRDDGRPL
ncbi:MAG: tRNA 2-thiouridine(34) synthase MnmA [Rhodospirillaceae bacterium]|jgi:tRNA-specific 2-thiouridylase|nr:tRNA 2-thiouridine(34) synthase MnmA [Rhodospirillaceae bacterium]|tara:strand:+ start:2728 stop:3843 length:1116 start_codon:yes stop_codon:yes gene_type:complete